MASILLLGSLGLSPSAQAWVACDSRKVQPPIPSQREAPDYPDAARSLGIQGTVELSLTILRDGSVGWVRILKAEPPGYFEEAAQGGVRRWRFEPARTDGEAVECRTRTRVRFTLSDAIGGVVLQGGDLAQPRYPAELLASEMEGHVELEYRVGEDGRPTALRVMQAIPRGNFEQAALDAVRDWQLAQAVPGEIHMRRFDFALPGSARATHPAAILGAAPLPVKACDQQISGEVQLEVDTDATGKVIHSRVLSASPEDLFVEAALATARGTRLVPAYQSGQPVAAKALLTLVFRADASSCPGWPGMAPPARGRGRPAPRVS